MLFHSWAFAIFLPIVFALYWLLPHRYRWALILVASCYFYMSWNAAYIALIAFATAVSYLAARLIARSEDARRKKGILIAAILLILAPLFFYKYFNFISANVTALLNAFALPVSPLVLKLLLPLGISFYTFQTLGYVIDVYRGDQQPETHFGKYAAFVTFFPQLLSGPIGRAHSLLPQIKEERRFDYDQATYGLKLMAWGFLKKMVIADTIGEYVDKIFNNLPGYTGFALVFASLLFAVQIYCDFSGYSDVAVGVAKLFGIDLIVNFKSPYLSSSIREFWSRWHISLSTWFRDYVYIPLGGSRKGKFRTGVNLVITFLVSGLWHGASWTYIVWGGLHGLAQVIENFLLRGKKKPKDAAYKFSFGWLCSVVLVFLFCTAAWVFFRANTLSDALYVFQNSLSGLTGGGYFRGGIYAMEFRSFTLVKIAGFCALLLAFDWASLKRDAIASVSRWPLVIRWCVYLIVVFMVIWLTPSVSSEFIYFEF